MLKGSALLLHFEKVTGTFRKFHIPACELQHEINRLAGLESSGVRGWIRFALRLCNRSCLDITLPAFLLVQLCAMAAQNVSLFEEQQKKAESFASLEVGVLCETANEKQMQSLQTTLSFDHPSPVCSRVMENDCRSLCSGLPRNIKAFERFILLASTWVPRSMLRWPSKKER